MDKITFKNPKSTIEDVLPDIKAYSVSSCERYFRIDRGLVYMLREFCEENKIQINEIDKTYFKVSTNSDDKLNLIPREDQLKAVDNFIDSGNGGLIIAGTSAGKTIIGLLIARKLKCVTTILVWSNAHQRQWYDEIIKFGIYDKKDIGGCGGELFTTPKVGLINLCMQQALNKSPNKLKMYNNVSSCVILDECQITSARTFTHTMSQFNAKFRGGLSASIHRRDNFGFRIPHIIGPIVYKSKDVESKSKIRCKINLVLSDFESINYNLTRNYTRLLNEMANDMVRNKLIISRAMKFIKQGKLVLIMVERKEHIINLKNLLPSYIRYSLVMGETDLVSAKKYKLSTKDKKFLINYDGVKSFKESRELGLSKKIDLIIGTQKVFVGYSVKTIEHGIIATPTAGNVNLFNQQIGRVERSYFGDDILIKKYGVKNTPTIDYIVDYEIYTLKLNAKMLINKIDRHFKWIKHKEI